MLKRINILSIVSEHFQTLRSLNQTSKKIFWGDVIVFFILPISIAGVLTCKKVDILSQVSNLIAAISILGGFLFNLLAIIYGAMDKLKIDSENNVLKKTFMKEIHTNISYSILTSIAIIVFLIIYSFEFPKENIYDWIKKGLLFINYFLLIHFFLTLLMVLNRIYILFKKDIE